MKAKQHPAGWEMKRSMACFSRDISGNKLHWKGEKNVIRYEWFCLFWVLTDMNESASAVFEFCLCTINLQNQLRKRRERFSLQAALRNKNPTSCSADPIPDRALSLPCRSTPSSPSCSPWSSFPCSTPSSPTSCWWCSGRRPRRTRCAPLVASRPCSACPWSPAGCKPWSTAWGSCVSIGVTAWRWPKESAWVSGTLSHKHQGLCPKRRQRSPFILF